VEGVAVDDGEVGASVWSQLSGVMRAEDVAEQVEGDAVVSEAAARAARADQGFDDAVEHAAVGGVDRDLHALLQVGGGGNAGDGGTSAHARAWRCGCKSALGDEERGHFVS